MFKGERGMIYLKGIQKIGFVLYLLGFLGSIVLNRSGLELNELFSCFLICAVLSCGGIFCIGLISLPIYIKALICGDKAKVQMSRSMVLWGALSVVLFFAYCILNIAN